MILDIIYIILGIILILWGADALPAGASVIARRLGVSEFVIGVIIVGLGTSMPEFTISVIGSITDKPELAIGNVVGSNIVNILFIVGVTAMIRPLSVTRSIVINEGPMTALAAIIVLIMSLGPVLDGTSESILTRIDGIILLIFFLLFIRYLLAQPAETEPAAIDEDAQKENSKAKTWLSVIKIVGGLAALIVGGNRFVAGASSVATSFGISEAIIGLTLAAIGTSLPELATSVLAARKGHVSLALGNVIGSNILNITLILGVSATIRPLPFGDVSTVDLCVMTGASVLLWLTCRFYKQLKISRAEGLLMMLCYAAYLAWLFASSKNLG